MVNIALFVLSLASATGWVFAAWRDAEEAEVLARAEFETRMMAARIEELEARCGRYHQWIVEMNEQSIAWSEPGELWYWRN